MMHGYKFTETYAPEAIARSAGMQRKALVFLDAKYVGRRQLIARPASPCGISLTPQSHWRDTDQYWVQMWLTSAK